jgi:hypothetical protein
LTLTQVRISGNFNKFYYKGVRRNEDDTEKEYL